MTRAELAARLAALETQHPPGAIHVVYPLEGETTEAALTRLGIVPGPYDHIVVVVYEEAPPDDLND